MMHMVCVVHICVKYMMRIVHMLCEVHGVNGAHGVCGVHGVSAHIQLER